MDDRLKLLAAHQIGLTRIADVVEEISPLDGAREFLDELRRGADVVIITDTFDLFAAPLLRRLGDPPMLCNTLTIEAGRITGYELRTDSHKADAVLGLQAGGHAVVAVGDSYNDLDMLRVADHGVLFRAPDALRTGRHGFATVDGYPALLDEIAATCQRV